VIKIIRVLFFVIIVRVLVVIILGLRIRHKERLPQTPPAIIVANHNSHLDTLVIMSLLPLKLLNKVRPVAAEDYFLRNRVLAWFSEQIIQIIPLKRTGISFKQDPLWECYQALERKEILIIYPEGSRGTPETLTKFKRGIAHLAKRYPQIPLYPIFLYGLGKALPKGEALLVPFFCDVFVGEPLYGMGKKTEFIEKLETTMKSLAAEGYIPDWE
jgi:1-acyl-sn-glycerol-3-phosphate acyltransferase